MGLKEIRIIPKDESGKDLVYISAGKIKGFVSREEAESLYKILKIQLGHGED